MTVEQILALARGLPPYEQERLLGKLQSLTRETDTTERQEGYRSLLDLAGTARSEHHDVSENKLKHLGEAYTAQ